MSLSEASGFYTYHYRHGYSLLFCLQRQHEPIRKDLKAGLAAKTKLLCQSIYPFSYSRIVLLVCIIQGTWCLRCRGDREFKPKLLSLCAGPLGDAPCTPAVWEALRQSVTEKPSFRAVSQVSWVAVIRALMVYQVTFCLPFKILVFLGVVFSPSMGGQTPGLVHERPWVTSQAFL